MRKLIYLSICLFLLNCKKSEIEPTYQSEAIISGFDSRMCACCGGWKIRANNVDYLVNKMPSDFEEKLNKTSFQVTVLLNYDVNTGTCNNVSKYIDVSKIKIK